MAVYILNNNIALRSCTLQGMIFNGDYFGADNSACVFFRDGWHKKAAETFAGWTDLAPLPDDLDTQYLIDLNIDEVPHIDMDALAASKIGILERLKQGLGRTNQNE